MSRFKPKRWARPRSHAARELAAGGAPDGVVLVTEILKDLWHSGLRRPSWARYAKKHGWMTSAEYYAMEATERDTCGDVTRQLYAESPFFRMLKKDTNFGASA
jgi:hypothetical protein